MKQAPITFYRLEIGDEFTSTTVTGVDTWKVGSYVKETENQARDQETNNLIVFQGWRLCIKTEP